MAFRQFRFREETDILLLRETLATNPFQFNNGLGWQLMLGKLTENYDIFPVTITNRTLRDRMNLLLDKYVLHRKDKRGSEKMSERDRLMEQVFQLRQTIANETMLKTTSAPPSKRDSLDLIKEQGQQSLSVLSDGIAHEVDRKEVLTFTVFNNESASDEHHHVEDKDGNEELHSHCKAKKHKEFPRDEDKWLAFLQEREERYLKLREQELEVRRLELETQQRREEANREEKQQMKEMQREREEKDREERSRILELLIAALQTKK